MVIKWLNMWVFPTCLAFQVLMSALCLSLNKVFPLNQSACSSIIWSTTEQIAHDSPSLHPSHPNIYSTQEQQSLFINPCHQMARQGQLLFRQLCSPSSQYVTRLTCCEVFLATSNVACDTHQGVNFRLIKTETCSTESRSLANKLNSSRKSERAIRLRNRMQLVTHWFTLQCQTIKYPKREGWVGHRHRKLFLPPIENSSILHLARSTDIPPTPSCQNHTFYSVSGFLTLYVLRFQWELSTHHGLSH